MSATNNKRRMLLLRIDPHCFYCNVPLDTGNSTVDHVIPRSKGGINRGNVVLACGDCNNKKADNDPVLLNVDFERVEEINQALNNMIRLDSDKQKGDRPKRVERVRRAIAALIGRIQQRNATLPDPAILREQQKHNNECQTPT